MWLRAMKGVSGIAPDMILRASACTLSSLVALALVCVARIYILTQYESMGHITAVYIHLHVLGVRPQVGPTPLLHCMREDVAFSTVLMCSLKLSLLSSVTPRNLAEFDYAMLLLPILIGLLNHDDDS